MLGSHRFAGTERHVLGLVTELRELGCHAELSCLRTAGVLRREAAALGVPVRGVLRADGSGYDIVHTHDGRSAVLGSVRAALWRAALVRTQHFVLPASAARSGWRGRSSLLAHRVLNSRLDCFVCVSDAAADAAKQRRESDGVALAVISPGVRLASTEEAERAAIERGRAAHPVVVTCGRLERERRFDILIDAIPLVQRAFPNCRFVVAGAGKAEAALKSRAKKLGVEGAIDWTGWLRDVGPVLARGHVYVNTWPAEGFGMATVEAMGYGLPVIVTDSGASPELVEDNISGRVIEALNSQVLAGVICELLSDRILAAAIGAAARERAATRYSFRSTAISMLDLYEQLPRSGREH